MIVLNRMILLPCPNLVGISVMMIIMSSLTLSPLFMSRSHSGVCAMDEIFPAHHHDDGVAKKHSITAGDSSKVLTNDPFLRRKKKNSNASKGKGTQERMLENSLFLVLDEEEHKNHDVDHSIISKDDDYHKSSSLSSSPYLRKTNNKKRNLEEYHNTKGLVNANVEPSNLSSQCSISEFMGRTIYLPAFNWCLKIELFPNGVLAADTNDPTCSNEEYSPTLTASTFEYGFGDVAFFESIGGPNGYSGRFELEEDTTAADVNLQVKELGNNEFVFRLIFPSCYMGPSYPCLHEGLLSSTVYVPGFGSCWRIGLFSGAERM